MKKLLMLLFVARVLIPGNSKEFKNVQEWQSLSSEMISLTLTDGRKVIVPAMWTIIEEK